MNITAPGTDHTLNILLRPSSLTTYIMFVINRGTNVADILYNYGRALQRIIVSQPDEDKHASVYIVPWTALKERTYYSIYLFAISGEITSAINNRLTGLKSAPVADAYITLKQALALEPAPPTIALLHRGLVYCTNETPSGNYRLTEGHFTVIEKPKTTYTTR